MKNSPSIEPSVRTRPRGLDMAHAAPTLGQVIRQRRRHTWLPGGGLACDVQRRLAFARRDAELEQRTLPTLGQLDVENAPELFSEGGILYRVIEHGAAGDLVACTGGIALRCAQRLQL